MSRKSIPDVPSFYLEAEDPSNPFMDSYLSVPEFRTAYMPPLEVGLDCSVEPTLAQQSFRDECDINNIMAKHQANGLIEHVMRYNGQYGDFSSVDDYQTALNVIRDANDAFYTLTAEVRRQFDNDPAQFLAFTETASPEDLSKLGLLASDHNLSPLPPSPAEQSSAADAAEGKS